MSPNEQLIAWVAGEPIHNVARDECCPDFSCCRPELLWPEEQRQLFADRPELRDDMLMMALGAALSGAQVHIAGSTEGEA